MTPGSYCEVRWRLEALRGAELLSPVLRGASAEAPVRPPLHARLLSYDGRNTEFFDRFEFMGIKHFFYIGPHIPLRDPLRTAARGTGRAALRPKA
jgi:hypothetical protein